MVALAFVGDASVGVRLQVPPDSAAPRHPVPEAVPLWVCCSALCWAVWGCWPLRSLQQHVSGGLVWCWGGSLLCVSG